MIVDDGRGFSPRRARAVRRRRRRLRARTAPSAVTFAPRPRPSARARDRRRAAANPRPLHRHVAVAEVIGDRASTRGRRAFDVQHALRLRDDFDDAAVVGRAGRSPSRSISRAAASRRPLRPMRASLAKRLFCRSSNGSSSWPLISIACTSPRTIFSLCLISTIRTGNTAAPSAARRRLAGQQLAVGAHFVGLRIDLDVRQCVVVHHVAPCRSCACSCTATSGFAQAERSGTPASSAACDTNVTARRVSAPPNAPNIGR